MNRNNHMVRRFGNGAKASVANVQAVESIIQHVGCSFAPKSDPFRELSREIEKCSRKIWQCVGDRDASQRQAKKARTNRPEDPDGPEPPRVESEKSKSPLRAFQKKASGVESRMQIEARINAMKYRDIQVECKQYGLHATGNKEVLRERLLAHLLEGETQGLDDVNSENTEGFYDDQMKCGNEEEEFERSSEVVVGDVIMNDELAITVEEEEQQNLETAPVQRMETSPPPARVSCSSVQAEADIVTNEKDEDNKIIDSDNTCKDPPGKAIDDTVASVGPEEYGARSPLAGFVKDALKSLTQSAQKSKMQYSDSIPEDDISPPASDVTSSTTSSKISGSRVRELVSKLSNPTNSALSKSVQAKKEARMARMAEMRGKSQQAKMYTTSKPSVTSTEYSGTLASLNATVVSSSCTKKNLAQQMREKALRKENAPANQMQPVNQAGSTSTMKHNVPLSNAMVADSLGATLKSGLGATLKSGFSSVKKTKSPPKPSETYEISDREDSDSDDSEAENEKRKKQIPSWAKKEQLYAALEAQYGCVEGRRVDPDIIFSEVETCNLEAIFGSKMNTKYRNRTSSGNWSRDQVTLAEKLVYKRAMGFGTVETAEI